MFRGTIKNGLGVVRAFLERTDREPPLASQGEGLLFC